MRQASVEIINAVAQQATRRFLIYDFWPTDALGTTATKNWVPEGSLAGFFVRREVALELVSGADFGCKLMFQASPGDLGGPGVDFRPKHPENRPENLSPDCLQVPR